MWSVIMLPLKTRWRTAADSGEEKNAANSFNFAEADVLAAVEGRIASECCCSKSVVRAAAEG